MVDQPGAAGKRSVVLDEIAEVIGEEATLNLAWRFRGLRLYVPKDPGTNPDIAKAIGARRATLLCDTYYRMTIYIPAREAIARAVLALDATGMTKRQIAAKLHILERQVYRILKQARDDKLAKSTPIEARVASQE